MKLRFDRGELRRTSLRHYLVRFAFGGIITVITGVIAELWGPRVGGLFLAFPAVLPASLIFINDEDGRSAAAADARGARLGAIALMGFAGFVWFGCDRFAPAVTLLCALGIWIASSILLWAMFDATPAGAEGRPPRRRL
jgi:hypothetical protein